jgi:DNA-binding response OmpR family regulator
MLTGAVRKKRRGRNRHMDAKILDAKILIATDDERSANILRAILRSERYHAIAVGTGEELLRIVRREPPDLIILDMDLSGMGGIELCRFLKEEDETQLIPVIIVTTPTQGEARVQAIEAGADDFLIKPVYRQELLARVRTALAMKRAIARKLGMLLSVKNHLAKFVPAAVRRIVEENPASPGLEKREEDVSVLFVDISGYTKLSQRIAQEQVTALIERYFSHFLDCIREEEGDIAEVAGDGILALFQSSDPQEHAQKAARAALRILQVTDQLNREHPGAGTPIAVHMGLNSGRAGVGSTRLEGALGSRWTFTASGPVTNFAARLGAAASPGTILVGAETARRIGAEFTLEQLEQIDVGDVKNLGDKVEGYRLGEKKPGLGHDAIATYLEQAGSALPIPITFATVYGSHSMLRPAEPMVRLSGSDLARRARPASAV